MDALLLQYKDDPKFQEFLRVHKRNAAESWNNDAILEVGQSYKEEQENCQQNSQEDDKKSEVADSESSNAESGDENEDEKVSFFVSKLLDRAQWIYQNSECSSEWRTLMFSL